MAKGKENFNHAYVDAVYRWQWLCGIGLDIPETVIQSEIEGLREIVNHG